MSSARHGQLSVTASIPGPEVLQSVLEAYQRGQTVAALRRAEAFAPLRTWGGIEPRILAARIAANAGATGLATRLSFRAWREDRRRPDALAQLGYDIVARRGPLVLWQWLRPWQPADGDPAEHVAEVLALQARAVAGLRDFAVAEALLARAEALAPAGPWVRLQRSYLLETQDHVEAALDTARAASALHPHGHYRPGVQTCAHLLQLLDRDEEAISLLEEADATLESGPIAAQLFTLLSENGRWDAAERALERYVALSPLLESAPRKWVTAQTARAAYHVGRRTDAARHAATLNDEFHRRFAAKLGAPALSQERVQLDVTFVRQHFKTCAPATLASIGRFYRLPSEQVQLAEAMCYDGTPTWQQRDWAEKNGWHVRQFNVTHESAVALVERGIPFALSTVDATSAHMMAVIGFDRTRGTLLLRDPAQPYALEVEGEEFLKRYRAFGPQGVVFVPAAERAQLDDLRLPDSNLYDDYQSLQLSLAKYDRGAAAAALERLTAAGEDGMLVWQARFEIAAYDANVAEQARCLDRLLDLFPDDPARLLQRFGCMRDAPRDERVEFLEAACAKKGADPALQVALARALLGDARHREESGRRLKRASRYRPTDANAIQARADMLWEQGAVDEATEWYRFAANLEGFREHLFQAWFIACRRTRRTAEALEHLRDRFERFGARSEQPALTLAWAWREMDQPARAREVLDKATLLRPGDGQLLLRASSLLAALARLDEADALLATAKGKVRDADWLRARLEFAETRLAFDEMLGIARELLAAEPLALDVHAAVSRAVARREGTSAALALLERACEAYPRHYGLRRMLVEWSREAGPEAIESSARALLRLEPSDAWGRRELASALVRGGRVDEALEEALEAARIEPRNSYSHSMLAAVHRRRGQVVEARGALRKAIECSVDNGDAIGALIDLARSDEERKADLAFVERELVRQVVMGDGLLAYVDIARPVLEPESLLAVLRAAHAERLDLWHAWAALVAQLGHMLRLDEALDFATRATQGFAHLPRAWLDLALVHRWRNDLERETAAAERAFELNPIWTPATLALTFALERGGRLDAARSTYERALGHSPQDAQLHLYHATLLWRLRLNEDALAAIERALRLAPGNTWAWEHFNEWAVQSGQSQRPAEFARALTRERPGEALVWLKLTRVLTEPDCREERFKSIDRAIELNPRSTEAWDTKAELSALAERFDDAMRACDEGAALCTDETHMLGGRRAWVEARRGRRAEAIGLMRSVLADNSGYVWGWQELASWLIEEGLLPEATAALEQLRKLRPHDSWVSRQLGFLRLEQKDRDGARKALAAALEFSPTDVAAAHGLFRMQLEDADLGGAEATVGVMQTHQPGATTLAAEIALRLRQRSVKVALARLQTLCVSPDPDPWPLDAATNSFVEAGRARAALKVAKRCAKDATCNPQTGVAIVRLCIALTWWFAAARAFMGFPAGAMQSRAAAPLIQGLADNRCKLLIRWVLWRRRAVLHRDDAAWGQVGYALSNFRRMKSVARWLADWQQRPNVAPWMLFNYCLALRHLGRGEEAAAVAAHAVEAWSHRDGSRELRLFVAIERAFAGATAEARAHLGHVALRKDVSYDQQMAALVDAVAAIQETPRAERRRRFRAIRDRLAVDFAPLETVSAGRDVRRTLKRAGELFQREGAGLRAWLWFKWKLNWQWSLLPLAPVAIASVFALGTVAPVGLGVLLVAAAWGFGVGKR